MDENQRGKKKRLENELRLIKEKIQERELASIPNREEYQKQMESLRTIKTMADLERENQENYKNPELSIYYDPVFNPFGAPPPGKPQIYRTGRTIKEDSDDEIDLDSIPLPDGPPPPLPFHNYSHPPQAYPTPLPLVSIPKRETIPPISMPEIVHSTPTVTTFQEFEEPELTEEKTLMRKKLLNLTAIQRGRKENGFSIPVKSAKQLPKPSGNQEYEEFLRDMKQLGAL